MKASTSPQQKRWSALLFVGFATLLGSLVGVFRGRFRPEEFDPAVVMPVTVAFATIGVVAFAAAFALPPTPGSALTVVGVAFAGPAIALGVVVYRAIIHFSGEYTRFSDSELLVWLCGVLLLGAGSIGHGIRAVHAHRRSPQPD